jgi:hypothetical protein
MGKQRTAPQCVQSYVVHDPQSQIKQAAIGKTNWDSGLRKDYQQVEEEMQRGTQPQAPGMTPLPGGGRTPMFEERLLGGA